MGWATTKFGVQVMARIEIFIVWRALGSAVGPTQAPVQRTQEALPLAIQQRLVNLALHHHLEPTLRNPAAVPPLHNYS